MPEITIVMLCVWSLIALSCITIEFFSPSLIAVWFAFGAVVTIFFTIFSIQWFWQILIFIVTSFGTLVVGYPLLKNVVLRKKTIFTNIDALINQEAIMLNNYDSDNKQNIGLAKIDGKTWTVDCPESYQFIADEKVIVVGVSGVKLIIKKL